MFYIQKEASNIVFITGINYKLKLMQKTHLHPIYYYRFDFDTEESRHKILYHNKMKGDSL